MCIFICVFVPELCLFVNRALDLCKLVLSTFWLNRPHEASLPHFSVEIKEQPKRLLRTLLDSYIDILLFLRRP